MISVMTAQVQVTYEGQQHCKAVQTRNGRVLDIDCPKTGGGEEFSPDCLVGAGLAGCMLLSMGNQAKRDELDISGAEVGVNLSLVNTPEPRIGAIDVTINMPRCFSEKERQRLERAAAACPIKHSFRPEVAISTEFVYPELM